MGFGTMAQLVKVRVATYSIMCYPYVQMSGDRHLPSYYEGLAIE